MDIDNLTYRVIGSAYKVYNTLGFGFLEKVYENSLKIELKKHGIQVQQQVKLPVWYEDQQVGIYFPDLWIEKQLIVEIKAAVGLAPEHEIQLVHYLAATGIDHGLLINFGAKVQIKRKFREYRPHR
ncbi:MAG TPA: GxxExxY protein [Pyrinomonadaceae bacterium]|nr:GxxExxY protein [Pyrinomonadaceae bacterium]